MARLHPGVYVEEVSSGVRPIEGVSTSTAAFVGKTEMGTLNTAVLATSMEEFTASHGGFLNDSYLAHAVLYFFTNGGNACYLARIAGSGAAAASIALRNRKTAAARTLIVRASSEGKWGNRIDVSVADGTVDPDNEFAVQVLRDRSTEVPPLPALVLETFDNLSMDPASATFVEKVVNTASTFIRVSVDPGNAAAADPGTSRSGKLAVGNGADVLKLGAANGGTETAGAAGAPPTAGTSRSGTTPATNPPADKRAFNINLNGDGAREIVLPGDAATGDAVAAAIQTAVRALAANQVANQPAYAGFTSVFDAAGPAYLLTSGSRGPGASVVVTNSTTTLNLPAGLHRFRIEVNGDGPHEVTLAGPQVDGPAIAAAIQANVRGITPKRNANAAAFANFSAQYDSAAGTGNPSLLLTSGLAGPGSMARISPAATDNVAARLKLGLTNSGREIRGSSVLRPAKSQTPTEYHLGDAVVSGNVDAIVLGDDGSTPSSQQYITGLTALDPVRDFSLLCIPGIFQREVLDAASQYCNERADCFFIADCRDTDDTVAEVRDFINSLTVKSSYAALYYPWLRALDPTGSSPQPILVPPSGFMAGMYARVDAKRGVWKAPAGTEANIGGAAGLAADTTDAQQDFLNPLGVNVLRSFPASGLVVWGARTLATRSDPEYRYIPVRRTAIFLEQSIYNGIQWAVFEPNDDDLWASLRANIGAFMTLQFRNGAFQGRTPAEAFFVKCDDKTTTQVEIDAGIVNILVGFAPLKPAEFVVLKLTQVVNQPAG